MQALLFLRKGCEAFLALVLDSKRGQVNLEDIPVIKEFPDVFLEVLKIKPTSPHACACFSPYLEFCFPFLSFLN